MLTDSCVCISPAFMQPAQSRQRSADSHHTCLPMHRHVQAAAEAEVQQLQSSLESANELLKRAMEAAAAAEAGAAEASAGAAKEVEALKARLAEAAGVLNAKDELREAKCVLGCWLMCCCLGLLVGVLLSFAAVAACLCMSACGGVLCAVGGTACMPGTARSSMDRLCVMLTHAAAARAAGSSTSRRSLR